MRRLNITIYLNQKIVFHLSSNPLLTQGKATVNLLKGCIGSGKLNDGDKAAVRAIMEDLRRALSS